MPVPENRRTCVCGRVCKSRSGMSTHQRSCATAIRHYAEQEGKFEREWHSKYWNRYPERWPTVDTEETMGGRR